MQFLNWIWMELWLSKTNAKLQFLGHNHVPRKMDKLMQIFYCRMLYYLMTTAM